MPDRTPEQPPSWPPASEPAATPTNPPRITARGVGHLPSARPEEEEQAEAGFEPSPEPAPAPADYADLAPSAPIPNQAPEYPPAPVEPEPPRQQQQWGEAPDMSGEWPPRENQDWISQQSRSGGWGAAGGGASWPGPSAPEAAPEAPADQSYRPDPNASTYGSDPYQSLGGPAETFQPEQPYRADPYQGLAQPGEAYQAAAPQAPPQQSEQVQAHEYQAGRFQDAQQQSYGAEPMAEPSPAPSEPEPPRSDGKVAPPPTHEGVRYAIYGIGGIITLGLIIAIVVMLGGPPADEPAEGGDEGGSDQEVETDTTVEGLDAERYTALAAAAGSEEWFAYRYGTAGENAASEELAAASGDGLATEPLLDAADRSVQGQLGYVTDDAELTGIDHVTVLEANDGAMGIDPRAGGRFSEDGPELELTAGSTADCLESLGGELGRPVALARPEQSGEINAHSVIAFSSGIVATAGISGAQGGTCVQLPEGQVPTDVALTDGNEVALVTTWSPADQTGAVVVIALADKAGSYQSSWSEAYPGLPNPGHFGTAEIVGQVELPITAPTSVDAWSNSSGSVDTARTTVDDNPLADTVATSAHALVGSLSEGQAVTVDLAPVLTGLAAQHIDGAEFSFATTVSEPVSFDDGVADVATNGESFAVATADGTVRELDTELSETAAVDVGANPSCLVVGAQSGQFIATSRGESAVRWVSGGEVVNELADSRLTDAMCASETPALNVQNYSGEAMVVLVSDFEGQALHSYLVDSATLQGGGSIGGDGFGYGGAYEVPGKPFDASVTLDLA
ncbi:hypothetical protein [Glycomyces tarimensis]